jgi:hypothetical protein
MFDFLPVEQLLYPYIGGVRHCLSPSMVRKISPPQLAFGQIMHVRCKRRALDQCSLSEAMR